jgi:hypothetical protein
VDANRTATTVAGIILRDIVTSKSALLAARI